MESNCQNVILERILSSESALDEESSMTKTQRPQGRHPLEPHHVDLRCAKILVLGESVPPRGTTVRY